MPRRHLSDYVPTPRRACWLRWRRVNFVGHARRLGRLGEVDEATDFAVGNPGGEVAHGGWVELAVVEAEAVGGHFLKTLEFLSEVDAGTQVGRDAVVAVEDEVGFSLGQV